MNPRLSITSLFLPLLLIACGGGSSPPPSSPDLSVDDTPSSEDVEPDEITSVVFSDIQYGNAARNTLDIYQPLGECQNNRPTVFFVHGGGFRSGDKVGNAVSNRAAASIGKGFNFVSINYRLEGDEPILSNEFQAIYDEIAAESSLSDPDNKNAEIAALEDSVDALNFLTTNQNRYCIDIDSLAFWGSSAGATNVLSLAYSMDQFGIERPEPAVVINYWGDLRRDDDLDFNEAPFLAIHGTADSSIDYQVAVDLTSSASTTGIPYTFYTDVNGGHNVDTSQTVTGVSLLELTVNFIEDHTVGGAPLYEVKDVD